MVADGVRADHGDDLSAWDGGFVLGEADGPDGGEGGTGGVEVLEGLGLGGGCFAAAVFEERAKADAGGAGGLDGVGLPGAGEGNLDVGGAVGAGAGLEDEGAVGVDGALGGWRGHTVGSDSIVIGDEAGAGADVVEGGVADEVVDGFLGGEAPGLDAHVGEGGLHGPGDRGRGEGPGCW